MEKRTYYHDVIIQIEDDADIDAICHRVEEALNNLHGDIQNIDYTTGVKVVDIFEDESPKCECEVLDYKELLMFSKMKTLPSALNNQVNLCDSCTYTYPECPSEKHKVIFGNGIGNDNICACNKYQPTIQPGPKEGHWILRESYYGDEQYKCSQCGVIWEFTDGTPKENDSYYCPHCGARMKGVLNEID